MNEQKLIEACFALSQDLMWEKDSAPIEQLPEQIRELSEMTNQFVSIAKDCYYQIEGQPNSEVILLGAIKYLNALAIPPLRGNYHWFSHSLTMLLEICHPVTGLRKDGLPFLFALQSGVQELIGWANNDDIEFE
jgi:hypothetical protein